MSRIFWVTAGMTLLSASVSAGYSLVALMQHGTADIYTVYALARSLALLLAVLFAIGTRRCEAVLTAALAMSIVQLIDAYAGTLQHDLAKTYGPLAFGLTNITLFAALVSTKEMSLSRSREGDRLP